MSAVGTDSNEMDHRRNIFRKNPSLLWNYYYNQDGFNVPMLAVSDLIKITSFFRNEYWLTSTSIKRNMLTFIEFILSWIAFMIVDYEDLDVVTKDEMKELHANIASLEEKLQKLPIFSINKTQFLRIESQFQHIFEAVKQKRACPHRTYLMDDEFLETWQPFFRSQRRFASTDERQFLRRLRRLYIHRRNATMMEILEELEDISESFPVNSFHFEFESSRDTAIRSIIAILGAAWVSGSQHSMSPARYANLQSYLWSVNAPPPNTYPDTNRVNDQICEYQLKGIDTALRLITFRYLPQPPVIEEETRPVLEKQPNLDSTPLPILWQKLGAAESLEIILEQAGDRCCPICQIEDVATLNFAIMDKCRHLFCYNCIVQWFQKKSTCPYCRAKISSWTTRDLFLTFLDWKRQRCNDERTD